MAEDIEASRTELYSDLVLGAIEKAFPDQSRKGNIKQRILSGSSDEIYGRCGYGGAIEVSEILGATLKEEVKSTISEHEDGNGHWYLTIPSESLIIDPTAGQFIPETSRQNYERYFKGNMFIGPRSILKK